MVHTDPTVEAAVGPRIRKSPFWDATVAAGLTSVSCYNHMWLPMSYGDPDGEYLRLTTAVSMWDVAAQRHIEVRGPDATGLVQRVTTVDVTAVDLGRGTYAPMVDHEGTLINDPVLLRFDDGSWRFSAADADIRLWIDAIGHAEGFDTTVRELPTSTLAIQGPRAVEMIGGIVGEWVEDLAHFEQRHVVLDGVEGVLCRSGWSTQGGVEIFLDDPAGSLALWDRVAAWGEPFGIGPGAPNPSERIENVLLSYGTDTGYHADPLEIGLGDVIDLDGPPFIGRDALLRIREAGPARQLLGAVIDGERIGTLPHPCPLDFGPDGDGQLRAAAWSPAFERNLGLVLIPSSVAAGATTAVRLPEGERALRLVALPFDEELERVTEP